jgi:tetratricopeptide (TPR) repeat protein
MVGRTIAQYDILSRVGGGGMGVVYRARDAKLGRTVALKFLPQQWSHDETAKQRFLREAQAASATNHPNICTIHDIETADDGQLFIVMAYYEGQTLKQRLEQGPLPVDEALDIATQMADGLAKAHAQGVVHRDVKPGNVMLTEDGVRILDFGLATFADALKLTIEHSTLGTAAYMSPEQVQGRAADARADVWAAGVVLYEMLAGHVPFQGSHAEAVSYAIRNETPAPLRSSRPGIPEEVEQLVFRALHKEPSVRYQSGRAMARALRMVRGQSLPQDLRTEPIPVPTPPPSPVVRWKKGLAIATVIAFVAGGLGWWAYLLIPFERTPVVVVPLANGTGYDTLEPYRLALTHTLVLELADSPNLAVTGWTQTLERLRGVIASGGDPSSRQVMQSLTPDGPGALMLVPTLLNESGRWRARVDIQEAGTGNRITTLETADRVSTLERATAYGLMIDLANAIQQYFSERRFAAAFTPRPSGARFDSLDAAKAYEEGIRAFDELEYARARTMFTAAAEGDPRNPMPLAWLSRVLQSMGDTNDSRDAADRAGRLVTPQTPLVDSLFVAAVGAEARNDSSEAAARYRELAERFGGPWLMELAAWFDRHGEDEQAVAAHQAVLARNPALIRPHLELCRLNVRSSELIRAEDEGRQARAGFSRFGDRALEAQALFCLTDALRTGDDPRREEARRLAESALQIFETSREHPYSLARAYNYVALAAYGQGSPTDAIASWERALDASRAVGNAVLEPLVLMNLGVANEAVGNVSRALDYQRQSIALYQRLGDERRAAEHRANVGMILIEYSRTPDQGLHDVENALNVFRERSDKDFEAYCLRWLGRYARNAGRIVEAERKFHQSLSIRQQFDFSNEIVALNIDLARARFDVGDYGAARDRLAATIENRSSADWSEALLHLAGVHIRLGDFEAAASYLKDAAPDVERRRQGLLPLLYLRRGELAVERQQLAEARGSLAQSAQLWKNDVPDAASVEARGALALIDVLEGNHAKAEKELGVSLEQARAMGRVALEARLRTLLARLFVSSRRWQRAIEIVDEMPSGGDRLVNPETLAQAHYWRSVAYLNQGDRERAAAEASQARKLVEDLQRLLPEQYRASFAARPDIRTWLGSSR